MTHGVNMPGTKTARKGNQRRPQMAQTRRAENAERCWHQTIVVSRGFTEQQTRRAEKAQYLANAYSYIDDFATISCHQISHRKQADNIRLTSV